MRIYEAKHFYVDSRDKPHVTREDGGHITIFSKEDIPFRRQLNKEQASELIMLTMLVSEAMTLALQKQGIDIWRVNIQENWNWWIVNKIYIHLYGRAKKAKLQTYGQALNMPHIKENPEFYASNEALTQEDVESIQKEVDRLMNEKYSDR